MNASSMSRLVVTALLLSVSPVVGAAGETPSAPEVAISAPGDGQRVATGWSGPVVVEVSRGAAGHDGRLSVVCPSSGYEHHTTFSAPSGRVGVEVAPVEAPASDCTATAQLDPVAGAAPGDDPGEGPAAAGPSAGVAFSVWRPVAFTDARVSPVFYPTVRDGFADTAELVFDVSAPTDVVLLAFDVARGRVVTERRAVLAAGPATWAWDGGKGNRRRASLPTGRYLLAAVAIDPVSGDSVAVIGATEIARRTITQRTVRSVPAVRAERSAHGACATGAGEARVVLVCRGTRTSWAELSAVVRVPRDARLRDARSRNEKPSADERPGRVLHDVERLSPRRARVSLRIDGRRALVVDELYVEWSRRVQQRPVAPVPGRAGIVAGEVTRDQGGDWVVELAPPG
ncbi:hypothetical protein JOE61_001399 [Nocardioides salarius]|uniref:FlgD Ig-like domain-containing protein n=1 Tax=Nocardioides salarius TaxID=374513 RepID=A0ABS2M8R8_9ACTN|nr:hypothetical protein [Nocardioides salarius]MBM7507585.1 hypothetical protein [Nocardioides salarius]